MFSLKNYNFLVKMYNDKKNCLTIIHFYVLKHCSLKLKSYIYKN